MTKAHHTAATWPEHHLGRIDRCFSLAIAGEESAMDGYGLAGFTVQHQRDHSGPDAARRMLQAGMEAQTRWRRKRNPARSQIRFGRRSGDRLGICPDLARFIAFIRFIEELPSDPSAIDRWKEILQQTARDAFAGAERLAGESTKALKAAVKGRGVLAYELKELFAEIQTQKEATA